MVSSIKPVEKSPAMLARTRLDEALKRLEKAATQLAASNGELQQAQSRASEELGLHIRNLGRIIEQHELS